MKLRGLRGATTCDVDTVREIDTKTKALVTEMLERNEIDHEDLVSIIFTATDDLHSQFPATAARALGLSRRMVAYYDGGAKPIPRTVALAVKALELGL